MDEPSTSSQDDNTSDKINILNDYVLLNIFQRLPLPDRVRTERVCRRWRAIIKTSWSNNKILLPNSFGWHKCTDKIPFQEFLLRCGKYVRSLKFPCAAIQFAPEAVNIVIKFCPNLTNINTTLITLNTSEVRQLTSKYKNLKKLTIGKIGTIMCEQLLRNWYVNNKNLQFLKLKRSENIIGRSLPYLPETLNVLIIKGVQVKSRYLVQALKNLKNLKRLILDYYYDWKDVVEIFHEHCTNLEVLQLMTGYFDSYQTYNSIMKIASLNSLRYLTLWDNSSVSDDFLDILTLNCLQLVYLDINYCRNITDRGLGYLVRLSNLRTLSICNIYTITTVPFYELSSLEILYFRGNHQLSDTDLIILVEFLPKLKFLDLSYCFYITDQGVTSAINIASSRVHTYETYGRHVLVCKLLQIRVLYDPLNEVRQHSTASETAGP